MLDHGHTRQPELNAEQSNLRQIDIRMRGLTLNSPDSPELERMKRAREDVVGKMSAADLAAYDKLTNRKKSEEELQADAEAERIAMDANKDKPPI